MLGLCRQFHCLPSQLEKEDARFLRLMMIEQMGNPEPTTEEEAYGG